MLVVCAVPTYRARGSHICVACRSVCDQDQMESSDQPSFRSWSRDQERFWV